MTNAKTLAYAAALLLALPISLASARGTLVALEGSATLERKGQSASPAAQASPVHRGDTLKTGEGSRAQLRMADDSVFSIAGGSALRIDDFLFPPSGKKRRALYTLQEGGFRTITGTIGKAPKDQYEVRTEQGTITVEGSAYSALICKNACAAKYRAGLYVKAHSGVITLANASGKVKLRAGQTAFAEAKASTPVAVSVSPFDDPAIAAEFDVQIDFETEVHPPRIEPEPPASPS